MKLYDRLIAGVVWLQKFTIFSPLNLNDDASQREEVVPWGNYAIGNNLYPNLFDVFVKYSPTAGNLIDRVARKIIGNIPRELKNRRTTLESGFTDTIYSLLLNASRDAVSYRKSFAIWVGYDRTGRPDEFKWIPLSQVRYVKRDPALYPHTDNASMLAILDDASNGISTLHYPYERSRIAEQQEQLRSLRGSETEDPGSDTASGGTGCGFDEESKLADGQILFYNTAGAQTYPDHVFNAMLPLLLTDPGVDTLIMSYLANSDLLKTYKRKPGATGADTANSAGGLFDGELLDSIWGADRNTDLTATAQYASDYHNVGPKSAGSTEYLNITDDKSVNDYVRDVKFPAFMDEVAKIDERNARRFCIPLEIPYEYVYKMESGVVNQDNREVFIKELNMVLEDYRDTFEEVINDILRDSAFDWRLTVPPLGAGKDDVSRANQNITR